MNMADNSPANSAENCPTRLLDLASIANKHSCSDVHLTVGDRPFLRIDGVIVPIADLGLCTRADDAVSKNEMELMIGWLVGERGTESLNERGSIDGAAAVNLGSDSVRFRFNIFQNQARYSIALRLLDDQFRSLGELGLSERLYELCEQKDGLILVAGPTGSGKSTTLASLVDHINQSRAAHIVTIEDPIEFVHQNKRSLISQRQIALDTPSFRQALVDALRQDPDVILVGEIRDLQTIRTAIEAAETGHLVFATVHAGDVVGAIERLVSVFPGDEQALINQMLSTSLRAVIVQHLLPARPSKLASGRPDIDTNSVLPFDTDPGGGRVMASEVLLASPAVANLISSGNLAQIRSIMETSASTGMYTLDACLARLYRERKLEQNVAVALARNPKLFMELAKTI